MKPAIIKTGGSKFNPSDRFYYFIACNVGLLPQASEMHDNILVAVNELAGTASVLALRELTSKCNVFVDSGIFNLTMEHARRHGVYMNNALALAPNEIDGFSDLFDRYVSVVREHCADAWGYIELDQGGRENKITTRTKLESMGLRPIPVYHPLNDGWDYFDYLVERYDRICFGNVVHADADMRRRLLATAWERHRKYPNLWIHFLGYTPNDSLNAMPINSADSSTWIAGRRWGNFREYADGKNVGDVFDMPYLTESDKDSQRGYNKFTRVAAYQVHQQQSNWRNHMRRVQELGFDLYPPMREGEVIRHGN